MTLGIKECRQVKQKDTSGSIWVMNYDNHLMTLWLLFSLSLKFMDLRLLYALQLIDPAVPLKIVENTPDDPRQRKPDITKAKELLGWEPKVKLREGLPLMEEDFRQRLGVPRK